MKDCIFCNIANKHINADIIYENDTVLAFKDINPKANVHILVIPKIHIDGLKNLENKNNKVMIALMKAINEITETYKISDSGFRIVINNGKDSGQEVSHLHFHILGGQYLPFQL